MRNDNGNLGKFKDEAGEEYYCPLAAANSKRIDTEWALDNCVEASTAGRYSGNINVADRFNT